MKTDAEAPILWLPDVKSWLIRKDPDAGKDWRQEEKGATDKEMIGWHHWLNGQEWVTDLNWRTVQKRSSQSRYHDDVITNLEPDILESEVKWALESITTNKASGGDGIPVELFQILEDDAVKVLHSICQHIWKTAVATGLEKVHFHSNSKERQCKRMLNLPHNCTHLTC